MAKNGRGSRRAYVEHQHFERKKRERKYESQRRQQQGKRRPRAEEE